MPAISEYGELIPATTLALQQLLAPAAPQVTARAPGLARVPGAVVSLNVFLYQEHVTAFQEGGQGARQIGTELHYLVTPVAAADATTDADSHRAYGAARALIDDHPVMTVPGNGGAPVQVRLAASTLGLAELTSLWIACQAPLTLSFVVRASLLLVRAGGPGHPRIEELVRLSGPGRIAVFSGPDAVGKFETAAAVAEALGGTVVTATLDQVVSPYINETEGRLRGLFDRAERVGSVLVLDEAGGLFGDETEVREAYGRYAGIEAAPILELLVRAPAPVFVVVREAAGAELARRADIMLQFPPGQP